MTSGTLTCDPPGRLEWWPRLLLSPVDVPRVMATGFKIYRGADGRTLRRQLGPGSRVLLALMDVGGLGRTDLKW